MTQPDSLEGLVAVVTGATDGIGAATALLLNQRGATVHAVGRSPEKAARVQARASRPERFHFHLGDLSSMRETLALARRLGAAVPRVDLMVHAVGTLLPRHVTTPEGLEANFATSYLCRFLLTRELLPSLERSPSPRLVNVAASAPRVPAMARVDFDDLAAVRDRVGMRGHGQAQLANDVFVVELSRRTRVRATGYGPGNVNTGIRREIPRLFQWLMWPFFVWSTREPEAVAVDLVSLLTGADPGAGARFSDRGRPFTPDSFITDEARGRALWSASEALVQHALQAAVTSGESASPWPTPSA